MVDRVGDSAPNMTRTLDDESMGAVIDASVDDFAKLIYRNDIDFEALTQEELERINGEIPAPFQSDSEYFDDEYDYVDDPDEEDSLSHSGQELPQPIQNENAKPVVNKSTQTYPADVDLTEIGVVIWQGKAVPTNDPDLFNDIRRYINRYANDGNKVILKKMMSSSNDLLDFSKQFLNMLDRRIERNGADSVYLSSSSKRNIFNTAMPDLDTFREKGELTSKSYKEYNKQCEALRLNTEYPGIYKAATGLFVLDAAKRIVQVIAEKQDLGINEISYRQMMGATNKAAESAIQLAKREIRAGLTLNLKREIEQHYRTTRDLKVAIKEAKVDRNELGNIDLFGRSFKLKRGETIAQAATRANREYKKSVADRIDKLEGQGLLPVLAAAAAQGRGGASVTQADIKAAQALIKAAKTSYGFYQSPKALIEQALGGKVAVDRITAQGGRDPVSSLLAALKADTRRNELLKGLQTFGRTLSRLDDKSASIKASHKVQAAQFAADALLKSGFAPPSVSAIRQAMTAQNWSLAEATKQSVRLRGLERGIVNALGDPAPAMKASARQAKQAVQEAVKATVTVDAQGRPETLGEAVIRALRRQRARRQGRDNDDDNSPKR